ncbi:hypothetical protein GW916_10015 [bacterium]|nr:hypothetical protein [bacterium]
MVFILSLGSLYSSTAKTQPLTGDTQLALDSAIANRVAEDLEAIDLSAKEFYAEIEAEALEFYNKHQVQLSNVPMSRWKRMIHSSFLHLESVKIRSHAIARYAKPATKTFLITNILSTFILPPILSALGQPGLAMLVLATPFEPFVAAGQVFVMKNFEDMKIIRKVGLKTFRDMRKIRKELLGMSERSHVISLVFDDVLKELKGHSIYISDAKSASHWALSIGELESVVRKAPQGDRWIEAILELKNKKPLYALQLWLFISERSELRMEVFSRLHSLERPLLSGLAKEKLSAQLHELVDLKRTYSFLEEDLARQIKGSFGVMSKSEREALKGVIQDFEQSSQLLKNAAQSDETQLLLEFASSGKSLNDLSASINAYRNQIRRVRKARMLASVLTEDRLSGALALREVLELHTSKPKLSCLASFVSLVRPAK